MVEDDLLLGPTLRRVLRNRGHEVEGVQTVSEGEARLQTACPEVLLLDREVAGRDGWALREKAPEEVRVVLMTGSAPEGAPPHYQKATEASILFKLIEG